MDSGSICLITLDVSGVVLALGSTRGGPENHPFSEKLSSQSSIFYCINRTGGYEACMKDNNTEKARKSYRYKYCEVVGSLPLRPRQLEEVFSHAVDLEIHCSNSFNFGS